MGKRRWRGNGPQGLAPALLLALALLLAGCGGEAAATEAVAELVAAPGHPAVRGTITLRPAPGGTQLVAELGGLPLYRAGSPPVGPHGFHIHEGSTCEVGDPASPFIAAGGHWNPDEQPHGHHAGDFPVLFAQVSGLTEMVFYTDRFTPADVIGRTMVIHLNPDDYRTQPSGDSGPRIACGVIVKK